MKLKLFSFTAAPSTVTVSDALFGGDINLELIAQAVHVYRSNMRQGGAKALTRGEVNRTGAKWFRQKGTGNARHGARTAPQFVGGGVAHGPTGQENWKRTLPKKMSQKAVIAAFSAQAQESQVSILADMSDVTGKTKQAVELINSIGKDMTVLVVMTQSSPVALRAFGNLQNVSVTRAERVNALEIATADHILVVKSALDVLEARLLSGKKSAVKAEKPAVVEDHSAKPVKKTAVKKTTKVAAPKVAKTATAKKTAAKAKKTV